jgi:hypothetical protein
MGVRPDKDVSAPRNPKLRFRGRIYTKVMRAAINYNPWKRKTAAFHLPESYSHRCRVQYSAVNRR